MSVSLYILAIEHTISKCKVVAVTHLISLMLAKHTWRIERGSEPPAVRSSKTAVTDHP